MIIRMDRPLANDHPDGPASCKQSSGWTRLLQKIIRMDRPLANDPSQLIFSAAKGIFSFSKYFTPFPLLQIFSPAKIYFPSPNSFLNFLSQVCSHLKINFPSPYVIFSISVLFFLSEKSFLSLNTFLLFLFSQLETIRNGMKRFQVKSVVHILEQFWKQLSYSQSTTKT